MNITSAKWADAAQTKIIATINGIENNEVPNEMGNLHRQAIARQEVAGNAIGAYVSPPTVHGVLSPRQLRLALLSTGTTETAVDDLLSAIPEDAPGDTTSRNYAKIEWKHATSFDRDHPLVLSIGTSLGYPETQIDTLWEWASAL